MKEQNYVMFPPDKDICVTCNFIHFLRVEKNKIYNIFKNIFVTIAYTINNDKTIHDKLDL